MIVNNAMKNKYGLSEEKLDEIFKRDSKCVYCKKDMKAHTSNYKRVDWYSIEHLNFLPPWNNHETVVICCWSCNSSRGNKKIRDWFASRYCIEKGINYKTVSSVVQIYIDRVEDLI